MIYFRGALAMAIPEAIPYSHGVTEYLFLSSTEEPTAVGKSSVPIGKA